MTAVGDAARIVEPIPSQQQQDPVSSDREVATTYVANRGLSLAALYLLVRSPDLPPACPVMDGNRL